MCVYFLLKTIKTKTFKPEMVTGIFYILHGFEMEIKDVRNTFIVIFLLLQMSAYRCY